MKITMVQYNPVVGDVTGNTRKLLELMEEDHHRGTDLFVFPELYLVGYPPRDLLEKGDFLQRTAEAVEEILTCSKKYPDTGILLGVPAQSAARRGLYNAAILICDGQILFQQNKSLLPLYDVFDEARYFDPASRVETFSFKGCRLGISICEDAWNTQEMWSSGRRYFFEPIGELARQGVDCFINLSASPYSLGKEFLRSRVISHHASKHGVPFIYVNQIGANDELVFDGRSMVFDGEGNMLMRLPAYEESVYTFDTEQPVQGEIAEEESMESLYRTLVLGIRDYFKKTGFSRAVLGLSGGIDSALTTCLAVAALGKENVLGISMPSQFSSKGSVDDSEDLAKKLGIDCKVISIGPIYESYLQCLQEDFKNLPADVTEENLQARIRGNLLMAFSNKFGSMVLSTGNKSEMAVGYCTLYGDMSGGLSVLSDVPKTMVYELSRYINREMEIIPWATIEKAPSAELRPDQRDEDSLPPYPMLDAILNDYIEENLSVTAIISKGFDPDTVHWVVQAVNRNEYKRKQAAPGIKVSSKAFGIGRRMPIAARYEV